MMKWLTRFVRPLMPLLFVVLTGVPAAAKVDVVAANQDLAWVAATVGGNLASVSYLASSQQDPHMIDPRPSQVVKLARAGMVIRLGMDLDLWFDSLIRSAGNSKIVPNAPGYVDASRGIKALQVPTGKLDPSRGDIHVYGNPHYFFGPSNLPVVARNVRDGFKRVDPKNAAAYDRNYQSFVTRLSSAVEGWKAKMAPHRGKAVVTYHMSLIYFLTDFGLREYGHVEPRPGLQPTAGHITSLATRMKQDQVAVILSEAYRPRRYADVLSKQSGAKVVIIPGGIGAEKGTSDYFSFMGAIVDRVAGAL